MDDAKKVYREGEETAKEAWRNRDGEDMSDAMGNAGDDIRRDLGNAGDDLRRTDVDQPQTPGTRPPGATDDDMADDMTDADAERPL